MADNFDTLGQRILQAARLAVAVHLDRVASQAAGPEIGSRLSLGRRVEIGRAGPQVTGAHNPSAAVMGPATDGVSPGRFAEGEAE